MEACENMKHARRRDAQNRDRIKWSFINTVNYKSTKMSKREIKAQKMFKTNRRNEQNSRSKSWHIIKNFEFKWNILPN
jgi:hypothetical protein